MHKGVEPLPRHALVKRLKNTHLKSKSEAQAFLSVKTQPSKHSRVLLTDEEV